MEATKRSSLWNGLVIPAYLYETGRHFRVAVYYRMMNRGSRIVTGADPITRNPSNKGKYVLRIRCRVVAF